MEFKDYYEILGVKPEASQDEIKRAFRKLARKYHPDVSEDPDAERKYKEAGEAYEALKDPEKRKQYDQLRAGGWRSGDEFRPPPGWEARGSFRGGGFTEADTAGFSDFFEAIFGSMGGAGDAFADLGGLGGFGTRTGGTRTFGRRPARMRGEDLHHRLTITLEEAYRGGQRQLTLTSPEPDERGMRVERQRTVRVKIPKGVTNGSQVRLKGLGGSGMGGGPAGDLLLEIGIAPHGVFDVDGHDVILYLPIAPWEAALGATVKVPTLGGEVELKVPPGAQNGQRLRLKGRGLPAGGGSAEAGNQFVVLRIEVPREISPRARELYEELARESHFNPRTHPAR